MPLRLRPAPARPFFFEQVLLPYRSLPPRGFNILMLGLAALSIVVGIVFVSLGAWPVCGFFGLDVGASSISLSGLSYRSVPGNAETLRLGGDEDLTVERVGIRGDRRLWRFQPFWVRVVFEENEDETNRLALASHGRTLPIGTFLPPPVRREVAATLRDALQRWRGSLNPTQTKS